MTRAGRPTPTVPSRHGTWGWRVGCCWGVVPYRHDRAVQDQRVSRRPMGAASAAAAGPGSPAAAGAAAGRLPGRRHLRVPALGRSPAGVAAAQAPLSGLPAAAGRAVPPARSRQPALGGPAAAGRAVLRCRGGPQRPAWLAVGDRLRPLGPAGHDPATATEGRSSGRRWAQCWAARSGCIRRCPLGRGTCR